jgi:hypothetical protein
MRRKSFVFVVFVLAVLLLLSSCAVEDDRLGILANTKWRSANAELEFYDTTQGLMKGSFGGNSATFEVTYKDGVLSVKYVSGCEVWKGDGSTVYYNVSIDGRTMTTEPKESGRYNSFLDSISRIWDKTI